MTIIDLLKLFTDDFKKLSFKAKLGFLFLVGFSYLAVASILYPDAATSRFQLIGHYFRAFRDREHLALDRNTKERLTQLRDTLARELNAQLDTQLAKECNEALKDGFFNSWTLSEASLALPAEAAKHTAAILARMDCWKNADGVTWREFPDDNSRKIPITACGIWAERAVHSHLNVPACEFLCNQQDLGDGWWGVYAGTKDSAYASTYATAMALIALKSACTASDCPPDLGQRCRNAIDRGRAWLSTYSENGVWRDYPLNKLFGNLRPGLSGFVVFALHFMDSGDSPSQELVDFDKQFISHLRIEELPAGYAELSGMMIPGGRIDHVRVFVRPAELSGIAVAYHSCSLLDRARALRWLRMIAPQMERADALATTHPWIAAEYLIALNQVLERNSASPNHGSEVTAGRFKN